MRIYSSVDRFRDVRLSLCCFSSPLTAQWKHFEDQSHNFLIRISSSSSSSFFSSVVRFCFSNGCRCIFVRQWETQPHTRTKCEREKVNERGILKESEREDVHTSETKTEVIVNGSRRASCELCFQGIDEDTSSVRVLRLDCLWESNRHVQIHLFTVDLSLSLSLLKCLSLSMVVRCLFTCVDRPPLHVRSLSLSRLLFSSSIDGGENWVRYLCVRQSIVHARARFSQVFIWQAMRQKEWEMADIDYDQFPLFFAVHNSWKERERQGETSSSTKENDWQLRLEHRCLSRLGNSIVHLECRLISIGFLCSTEESEWNTVRWFDGVLSF